MNLLAILIGLAIERLATRFFHWRRLRLLERVIDAGFRQGQKLGNWPAFIPVLLIAILLVLPLAAVIYALGDTLQGFAYLGIATVVMFLSIGPRDIGEAVDEYCAAVQEENDKKIRETANSIIEGDVPEDPRARIERVEEAVCVQANNRLFAVIFWFVLLGPLAAWTYRIIDLIRRRAVYNASRSEETDGAVARMRDSAVRLHGWLAWIPARLTALGYVTAGHADDALAALRSPTEDRDITTSVRNERLLARVGVAALALHDDSEESLTERAVRGAKAANKLVFRLMLICVVIIAAMTLYGYTQ